MTNWKGAGFEGAERGMGKISSSTRFGLASGRVDWAPSLRSKGAPSSACGALLVTVTKWSETLHCLSHSPRDASSMANLQHPWANKCALATSSAREDVPPPPPCRGHRCACNLEFKCKWFIFLMDGWHRTALAMRRANRHGRTRHGTGRARGHTQRKTK